MTSFLRFFAFFLLVSVTVAADDQDIILKPLGTKQGLPAKVLIYIPGGAVPNVNYTQTGVAIQNNTEAALWIVIPAVFKRLCILQCTTLKTCGKLYKTVNGAISKAETMGMPAGVDQHVAGHSLGGTCANYLVQAYGSKASYKSLMVMGAYVDETGVGSLENYKIPVATIGAELDGGMARPGKVALWAEQFKSFSKKVGLDNALMMKPVVIIDSIDHSDFCPGFPVPGDLPSEIDSLSASMLIGQVSGAYLNMQILPRNTKPSVQSASLNLLKKFWQTTQDIVNPIITALNLEVEGGQGKFKPGPTSPWCSTAQVILSGVSKSDQAKISINNQYANGDRPFEHTRVHYTAADGRVTLNISSHASYYIDIENTGTFISAKEIGCKLANFDRIAEQLNVTVVSKDAQCRDVNEQAFRTALAIAPARSKVRYNQKGRGVCFANDTTVAGNIGPLFILTRLKLTDSDKCLTVQSIKLQTFLGGKILPGIHYCKLLSPARILDWIMTDSLKPPKK